MKIDIKKPKLKKRKSERDTMAVNANFAAVGFSSSSSKPSFGSGGSGSGFGLSGFSAGGSGASFGAGGFAGQGGYPENDGSVFEVDVRNADAAVTILDESNREKWYRKILAPGLGSEIGIGLSLMSLIGLLLAAAEFAEIIPFAFAGVMAYLVMVKLGDILSERIKYIAAAIAVLVLVALVIVFRKYIGGGIGSIFNFVYDASEAEQAYVYNRFNVSAEADSDPDLCIALATIWMSVLIGVIAAVPPALIRRIIGIVIICASMIAFAYYGILPSAVCLVIIAFALAMLLAGGSMLATLPVLLVSLLLFGAIMLIDTGENYGISRADENLRDRFALRSAYLETNTDTQMPEQSETAEEEQPNSDDRTNDNADEAGGVAGLMALVIPGLVILAIAAVCWLLYSRYKKRRAKNRLGLDNPDPKKAIIAMFPYSIKWLAAGNMEVTGRAFEKLIPTVERSISPEYAENYADMFRLWQEAAYSDHAMDEEGRQSMQSFLDSTITHIKSGYSFRDKILSALKYAL